MMQRDDVDVDAVTKALDGCPAVAGRHPGGTRFAVTYLPGRRVEGVRVDDQRVLVSVVLAPGASVPRLEKQIRDTLATCVGGRYIDIHVADVETGEGVDTEPSGEQR